MGSLLVQRRGDGDWIPIRQIGLRGDGVDVRLHTVPNGLYRWVLWDRGRRVTSGVCRSQVALAALVMMRHWRYLRATRRLRHG